MEMEMEEIITENKVEKEKGITLIDLWIIIQKYWAQLIVFSIIAAIAVAFVSYFLVDRVYTASTKIMINANRIYDDETSSVANQSKNYGLSLYPSINDMLTTTNTVTHKLSTISDAEFRAWCEEWVPDYDPKNLEFEKEFDKKNISCTRTTSDTLLFTISYSTTTSREAAISTANALAYSLIEVANIESADSTAEKKDYVYPFGGMLSPVELATTQTGSHPWRIYPVIAFLGVFILLYVYFLLINIFDDSVRSKAEIEEITGFNVIAYIEDVSDTKRKKKA